MSLATRCPDCAARLVLAPNQLRIAGGWVRCGRCDEVFNAAVQLERRAGDGDFLGFHPAAATTLPEGADLAQLPRLPAGAETRPALVASPQEHDSPAALDKTSAPTQTHESQAIATPILRPAVTDDSDSNSQQDAEDLRPLRRPDEKSDVQDRSKRASTCDKSSAAALTAPAAGNTVSADLPTLSFLRDTAASAAALPDWKARWLLYAAVALLAAALAVQIALAHRNRLAASAPAVAPGLQALCKALGCKIEPAHRIDALVIDHSSLNKKTADEYRLQVAIRNQSDIGLATPAIELTLTDMQDRPVVRRALLPSDIGAGSTIAAHGEWSGAVTVAVAAENARIVGYKVLAFYP